MTEENSTTAATDAQKPSDIEFVQDTLNRFIATASVNAAYGQPVQSGKTTVIPTAEVLCGMGFGMGSGGGSDEENKSYGNGSGGGGGGRTLSRPVAMVIISPDSVRVEPIIDLTKIALAGLTAAGFMTGMLMRMWRGSEN